MVNLSSSVRSHSKILHVSGSILVHAGAALFIPLILIVAAKMIIHIPRHHILKLYANGAIEPLIIQIKLGTVICHVHKHLGNEHLTRNVSLQNAKLSTWSLSLNIQSQDSDPLHVPFVMNVINIPTGNNFSHL